MTPEEEQALLEQELIEGDVEETPTPVDAKITLQRILADQAAQRELQKQALAEELKDRIAKRTTNIDFTPLAAQLDSLFGGKASQQAAQSAYAQGAEDDAGIKERYDQLLSIAGKPGSGDAAAIKLLQNAQEAAAKAGRSEKNFERNQAKDVTAAFKDIVTVASKDQKDLLKTKSQFDQIEDAFTSGNPERVRSKLGAIAKKINEESGALSDSDVGRQFLESFGMSFINFMNKVDKGEVQFSDSDIAGIADNVKAARRSIAEAADARINSLTESYRGNSTYEQAVSQAGRSGGIIDNIRKTSKEMTKSRYSGVKRKEAAGTKPAATSSVVEKLKAAAAKKAPTK